MGLANTDICVWIREAKGTPLTLGSVTGTEGVFMNDMNAYVDADYASCMVTRRSTTGSIGASLLFGSHRQGTVATSTAEAEYMGLGDVGKDIVWIRELMASAGVQWKEDVVKPTTICLL